jgi:hypothetical protein
MSNVNDVLYAFRSALDVRLVGDEIRHQRYQLPAPMPGEPNYNREEHVRALSVAIEHAKAPRMAHARVTGSRDRTKVALFESKFDAAIRELCESDPCLSLAYFGSAKMRTKLKIVGSE